MNVDKQSFAFFEIPNEAKGKELKSTKKNTIQQKHNVK